jgi:hypothetical protein
MGKTLPENWIAYDPIAQEYFHNLYNTLVLLGSDVRFAVLLKNPEVISETDVAELRRYNGELVDATKSRLVNVNTVRVTAKNP